MNCDHCGNPLARVLGEETITTLEGETVIFRRRTDYLLCRVCLRLYSVIELRDRGSDESPQPQHRADVPDLSYFTVLESESDNGGRGLAQRAEDEPQD